MWQSEGFVGEKIDVRDAMEKLERYLATIPGKYMAIPEEERLRKPAPGKWSRQEILGHLIDSALNNLKRFTDIQFAPQPYVVLSYKQDELVLANNYQNLPIDVLLSLWESLNKQIIVVVRNIPGEKLKFQVDPGYENGGLRTLAWIICDYVAHMDHHFRQVFAS